MDTLFALLFVSVMTWTTPARGQRIYDPVVEWEREIDQACKRDLDHPPTTIVALIEYDYENMSDVEEATFLFSSNAPNENTYTEPCTMNFTMENGTTLVDRPILHIFKSETCHDVLFFNDTENPVVCLYLIERVVVDLEEPGEVSLAIISFILLSFVLCFTVYMANKVSNHTHASSVNSDNGLGD